MNCTADQIIGVQLIAAKSLPILNYSLKQIGTFKAGDIVGRVKSYVQLGTPNVYWVFRDRTGKDYLVQHNEGNFQKVGELKAKIEECKRFGQQQIQQQQIEAEGKIPYYIRKYGIVILLVIAGTTLLKTYIQKRG